MVYLLLADGFEEIEALMPVDMLRRASIEVKTVGIGGRVVTGAHGISVVADLVKEEISSFEECEMLILPGGMPGTLNLDASPFVDRAIREVLAHGGRVSAICAAPLILGRRGLLSGKEAICFPGFEEELVGARISKKTTVTDGKITTSAGMEYALEFAKELVRLLK